MSTNSKHRRRHSEYITQAIGNSLSSETQAALGHRGQARPIPHRGSGSSSRFPSTMDSVPSYSLHSFSLCGLHQCLQRKDPPLTLRPVSVSALRRSSRPAPPHPAILGSSPPAGSICRCGGSPGSFWPSAGCRL